MLHFIRGFEVFFALIPLEIFDEDLLVLRGVRQCGGVAYDRSVPWYRQCPSRRAYNYARETFRD
jgi:hypothetical protein